MILFAVGEECEEGEARCPPTSTSTHLLPHQLASLTLQLTRLTNLTHFQSLSNLRCVQWKSLVESRNLVYTSREHRPIRVRFVALDCVLDIVRCVCVCVSSLIIGQNNTTFVFHVKSSSSLRCRTNASPKFSGIVFPLDYTRLGYITLITYISSSHHYHTTITCPKFVSNPLFLCN